MLPVLKYGRSAACVWALSLSCILPEGKDTPEIPTSVAQQQRPARDTAIADMETSDSTLYHSRLLHLLHSKPSDKWKMNNEVPLPGAVLPYNRIIAFYGNFYTPAMGILGTSEQEMLKKLKEETVRWAKADTLLPVLPALHYIAVTAQRQPGKGHKYRLRMPATQLDKAVTLANQHDALIFLDVQVGHSTLQEELPLLEAYLRLPQAHLGIDPEYSMKNGEVPCAAIGTFDAADINYSITFLSNIVRKYHLPPKILIIHRFTQAMITNYRDINIVPEVQVVINMDGFGSPAKKTDTYKGFIAREPIQYTGFKLFYKNDVQTGGRMMTPEEILKLYPSPVYIQYQ